MYFVSCPLVCWKVVDVGLPPVGGATATLSVAERHITEPATGNSPTTGSGLHPHTTIVVICMLTQEGHGGICSKPGDGADVRYDEAVDLQEQAMCAHLSQAQASPPPWLCVVDARVGARLVAALSKHGMLNHCYWASHLQSPEVTLSQTSGDLIVGTEVVLLFPLSGAVHPRSRVGTVLKGKLEY